MREIKLLSELRDPHLVQYKNCWIENDQVHIQMELCQYNLSELLVNKIKYFNREIDDVSDEESDGDIGYLNVFELSISIQIFKQITCSLKVLHEFKIIHRDLKPENILIKVTKEVIFKIGDFGLSKFLNQDESTPTKNVGTNKYMAWEVAKGEKYNFKADIYSLGVILLDLLDVEIVGSVP